MKKHILLASAMTLLLVTPVLATETCANGGGVVVTSHMGESYCVSNVTMNWWSAFSWCEAAGYTLADATQDCVCITSECDGLTGMNSNPCINFLYIGTGSSAGTGDCWSRNEYPDNTSNAYFIYLPSGSGSNTHYVGKEGKTALNAVLCKM